MAERLSLLSIQGFDPKVIYDIGAYTGEMTKLFLQLFKPEHVYMFEANKDMSDSLNTLAKSTSTTNCIIEPIICTLSNKEETRTFFQTKSGVQTGNSILKEQTPFYEGTNLLCKTVETETLASCVARNKCKLPDMVKIDVQGAELLVMNGGIDIIRNAEVVILEVSVLQYNEGAPLLHEVIDFMRKIDFIVIDLLDLHYFPNNHILFQMDLIFAKTNSKLILRPPFVF